MGTETKNSWNGQVPSWRQLHCIAQNGPTRGFFGFCSAYMLAFFRWVYSYGCFMCYTCLGWTRYLCFKRCNMHFLVGSGLQIFFGFGYPTHHLSTIQIWSIKSLMNMIMIFMDGPLLSIHNKLLTAAGTKYELLLTYMAKKIKLDSTLKNVEFFCLLRNFSVYDIVHYYYIVLLLLFY